MSEGHYGKAVGLETHLLHDCSKAAAAISRQSINFRNSISIWHGFSTSSSFESQNMHLKTIKIFEKLRNPQG